MAFYFREKNYAKYFAEKCLICRASPLSLYINRHLALPAHGFVCWRQDGDCLRETVRKIFGIEKEEESND